MSTYYIQNYTAKESIRPVAFCGKTNCLYDVYCDPYTSVIQNIIEHDDDTPTTIGDDTNSKLLGIFPNLNCWQILQSFTQDMGIYSLTDQRGKQSLRGSA